ncbi:MAG: RelA/SpoT family protein [Patescibacteria group bacterium]
MSKEQNRTISSLIEKIKNYDTKADLDMIRLAYDYAEKAHQGQTRKSGEPYIIHPLATAHILADMKTDYILVIAALLHDVPEDTEKTLEDLEKEFGPEVMNLVKGITKLGKLKYRGVARYIENLRKMFVAMAEDVRVMIIKFADRIHNLSTLDSLPPQKRYRIALESLEIYAPLADRLGMDEIKSQLEDLSFKYVYPKEYERISELRQEKLKGKEKYFKYVIEKTKRELEKTNIHFLFIGGRNKTLYSLYKKMQKKNNDINKIYDIVAVRVIVKDLSDCYSTLGIIHNIWRPMKGRIKDYISQPKPNGYQSLHTTVFGDADGQPIEFQIRTEAMHEHAEYGIAAHWHYDEYGSRMPKREVDWARELADIQKDILNKLSDLEQIKIDFLQTRIFVFTPKGDVIDLPEGSTPVDFAYSIHTDIGNKCTGVLINEKMSPLDTSLNNGDVVDIIIDKKRKGPNEEWLEFVKTHSAQIHIRDAMKKNRGKTISKIIKSVLSKKED